MENRNAEFFLGRGFETKDGRETDESTTALDFKKNKFLSLIMDFTKAENRICRSIFEIGLQRQFAAGMNEFTTILQQWQTEKPADNRAHYYAVFNAVKDFDKKIAIRYDGLRNSMYYATIIGLLNDDVIKSDDLFAFSEERKLQLLEAAKRWKALR